MAKPKANAETPLADLHLGDMVDPPAPMPEAAGTVLTGPPTAEQVQVAESAASAAVSQRRIAAGTVLGLPDGWQPYVIDLSVEAGRVEHWRAALALKGYVKAAGLKVAGIAMPEVWVIPRTVYETQIRGARQSRDDARRAAWKMRQIPTV